MESKANKIEKKYIYWKNNSFVAFLPFWCQIHDTTINSSRNLYILKLKSRNRLILLNLLLLLIFLELLLLIKKWSPSDIISQPWLLFQHCIFGSTSKLWKNLRTTIRLSLWFFSIDVLINLCINLFYHLSNSIIDVYLFILIFFGRIVNEVNFIVLAPAIINIVLLDFPQTFPRYLSRFAESIPFTSKITFIGLISLLTRQSR